MTKNEEQAIAAQIRAKIEAALAAGHSPQATWIVNAIVSEWDPPRGRDSDKWTLCGYANVRTIVRSVVRSYKPDDESDDSQLILDGFERLHKAYLVSRDDEQAVVRVDRLTVSEALTIIDELNRSKRGLDIHIAEMQRYIDEVLIPRASRGRAS